MVPCNQLINLPFHLSLVWIHGRKCCPGKQVTIPDNCISLHCASSFIHCQPCAERPYPDSAPCVHNYAFSFASGWRCSLLHHFHVHVCASVGAALSTFCMNYKLGRNTGLAARQWEHIPFLVLSQSLRFTVIASNGSASKWGAAHKLWFLQYLPCCLPLWLCYWVPIAQAKE